jgi:hypothetical protein
VASLPPAALVPPRAGIASRTLSIALETAARARFAAGRTAAAAAPTAAPTAPAVATRRVLAELFDPRELLRFALDERLPLEAFLLLEALLLPPALRRALLLEAFFEPPPPLREPPPLERFEELDAFFEEPPPFFAPPPDALPPLRPATERFADVTAFFALRTAAPLRAPDERFADEDPPFDDLEDEAFFDEDFDDFEDLDDFALDAFFELLLFLLEPPPFFAPFDALFFAAMWFLLFERFRLGSRTFDQRTLRSV